MSDPSQVLTPLTKPDATDEAIKTAVQAFKDQAQTKASSIGDYVWDAFNAVFDAAGRTRPEDQGRLIEFLTQLRQVTVTGPDGKPLEYEDMVVWKDLPSFGWVARECWNFGEFLFPRQEPRIQD